MSININGDKYLFLEEVLDRVNMKQTDLYIKMKYKEFPRPFKPEKRTFWKESEVEAYLEKTRKEQEKEDV
jgi:predicted DNA-binding transcriptional regulator AlpA